MSRRRRHSSETVSWFYLTPESGGAPIPKDDALLCRSRVNVTDRVRRVLGLGPGSTTLPKAVAAELKVDGRRVVIKKSIGGAHRMFIETNSGKLVPTGRLRQAVCKPRRGGGGLRRSTT